MKTVAVYFTKPGFDEYPFDEERFRKAYEILAGLLEERGAHMWIVRGQATYRGGNRFSGGWEWRNGAFYRSEGERTYDVIFQKGKLACTPDARLLNDPELDALCTDKWKTITLFPDLSPRTLLVQNEAELKAATKNIGGAMTVAKPLDDEGGTGVIVAPPAEVRKAVPAFPYLVQEFLDTSGGIPGIVKGLHDFRMNTIQGEIVSVFIREPKEGSYLANVAQGACIWEFPTRNVPAGARAIFDAVETKLKRFEPRVYSVDVARGKNGVWKLIELNAQPGLSSEDYEGKNDPEGKGEGSKRFFRLLADLLAGSKSNTPLMSDNTSKRRGDRYDISGNAEAQYVDAAEQVLKNKKTISDLRTLYVEEEKALARAYELLLGEVRSDTPLTTELILYAHQVIFDDLYEWAGRWRTVRISKPGVSWPPPDFLEQAMKDFERDVLRKYPAADLTTDDAFCAALGHIQGEFLAIHPLREGNARTIKLVTDLLAVQTNHLPLRYDMTAAGKEKYIDAAKAALLQNYKPISAIIRDAIVTR